MNRRDLLKRAGALAAGLPALRASGLSDCVSQSHVKDLVVSFSGPFCFWMDPNGIRVMAPPVGVDYDCAPHQAWIGTSTNEMQLNSSSAEAPQAYSLQMNPSPVNQLSLAGTPVFTYDQRPFLGADPLFNLMVPMPAKIIGVRPTCAKIIYRSMPIGAAKSGAPKRSGAADYLGYASGLTFLYQNVDLSTVTLFRLTLSPTQSQTQKPYFKPCFDNDNCLPGATLGIHLTKLDRRPDPTHRHASYVWSQMMSMYPWMLQEIKGIEFYELDPGSCKCTENSAVGPGNDCEVPGMLLQPGGQQSPKRK